MLHEETCTVELHQWCPLCISVLLLPRRKLHQCYYCLGLITSCTKFLPSSKAKKLHQCGFCSYFSLKKSHLEYHLLTHTGERPFACGICSKAFRTKGNLKQHLFTHSRESISLCD
ncbi:Ichor like protein [Argiope bruennichi]|uniref:Ichor like protein n=1 Tax=Argiope bruennichi TaxID=94029 RepID=A0A8T0EB84_ARGBR|nr:Ichor like protein [Argiope bruennichi]